MTRQEERARDAAMVVAIREDEGYDCSNTEEVKHDHRFGDEGPGSWTRCTTTKDEWKPFMQEARAELERAKRMY